MMRSRMVTGIALVTAIAAGGVGGALIGVPSLSGAQPFSKSAAATDTAAGTKPGRPLRDPVVLDAAAAALHLTTQQLRDKLSDGKTTIADVAKQQNVDIATVIDAMTQADKQRMTDIVNKPWPKFGTRPGVGPGMMKPGMGKAGLNPGGLGLLGGLRKLEGLALDPVAKALGITPEQLKTDLANGQSIADIAKSKNLDLNTVIDSLVADASKRIDQAVTDKHLTQAQADKLKSALKPLITNLVNGDFPKGLKGGFPGHRGFGGVKPGAGFGSTTTTTPPAS